MKKKSLKPEGQMLRGVVYRLIESLASMGHSSIWKLICAISVCNTLTVGVHLSSTPSTSDPGSATDSCHPVEMFGVESVPSRGMLLLLSRHNVKKTRCKVSGCKQIH